MIFRIFASLTLTSTLIGLSACAPESPNQWVPKGYAYHDITPISSPAPSSPWIKSAETSNTENIADSTTAWQGAAFELIDGLQNALPTDGSPINVQSIAPVTNQDLALDHFTRQALRQKNITLTTTNDIGSQLWINAQPLTNKDALAFAVKNSGFSYAPEMDLTGLYLLTAALAAADGTSLGQSSIVGIFPHENRTTAYSGTPLSTGISKDPTPIFLND